MYVDSSKVTSASGKTYTRHLLRSSYRDENGKVKKRTHGNLSDCSPQEIELIRSALNGQPSSSEPSSAFHSLFQGKSLGAVALLLDLAKSLGIQKALGQSRDAQLALWQVLARVLDQGSRLSATRLAKRHAYCQLVGLGDFDENTLYTNLDWLEQNQALIEKRLFQHNYPKEVPTLYLYDVTSNYLEGEHNALAAFGYNRDGKKGKKQIVVGLLCDEEGKPLSIEVFRGNTNDTQTVSAQVQKAAARFGAEKVCFVGDRGMIKGPQIKNLEEEGFHYITAISKPQVEKLIKEGTLQLELFETELCEIAEKDPEGKMVRYVLRRNPVRAEEIAKNRRNKQERIQREVEERNAYLEQHPKASVATAIAKVQGLSKKLKLAGWLKVQEAGARKVGLEIDEAELKKSSELDGCYVIKTDLKQEQASKEVVHGRYKDLAMVERAFRTAKTGHLEMRPIYVQKESRTRGHVLVVMLAYRLEQELRKRWVDLDVTVEEGLKELGTLCVMEMKVDKVSKGLQIVPEASERCAELLKAAGVKLPKQIGKGGNVATKVKLPKRRLKR